MAKKKAGKAKARTGKKVASKAKAVSKNRGSKKTAASRQSGT